MISTPLFAFGGYTPMYCCQDFNTVNSVYQNDNGGAVREFFVKDAGPYINPFYALFRTMPQNCGYSIFSGGGGCSSSEPAPKAAVSPDPEPAIVSNPEPEQNINSENNSKSNPFSSTPKAKTETKKSTSIYKPKTTAAQTNPIKHTAPKQTDYQKISSDSLGRSIINVAYKYSDCNEMNGSHHKFCVNPSCKEEDPYDQEWCTDFVTYVVKEAYKNKGISVPAGFGDHDVETMKNWAINKGMFIRTSDKRNKESYIAANIKPGDIFIMNENDASHTGIVTSVNKEKGTFNTIEGNRDDMVKTYSYDMDDTDLSGFIRLKP